MKNKENIINNVHKILESEDFYNIMQKYRHSKINNQKDVCKNFDCVKNWLIEKIKETINK